MNHPESTMDERYASLIRRHLHVARVCADLVDEPGPQMAVLLDEAERLLARWEAGEPVPEVDSGLEAVLERLEVVERRFEARRPASPLVAWRAWLARPAVWGTGAVLLVVVLAVGLVRWWRSDTRPAPAGIATGGVRADRFQQGWGVLTKDKRPGGEAVVVEGKPVGAAFITHALSHIEATVVDAGTHLSGLCGYPDDKRGAKINCRISTASGKVLFDSAPLDEQHRAAPFDVVVPADRKLVLEVRSLKDNINFAHAVWANLAVRP